MTNTLRHNRLLYIVGTILLVLTVGLCLWRTRPLTEEELRASDAVVEREECYLLLADGDTLLSFSGIDSDSIFRGAVDRIDNVGRTVTRVSAQWVNRWPVIPSCGGRLALLPADTLAFCKTKTEQIHSIIGMQRTFISQLIATLREHQEHTDYYLRTHNVTEMGFDVVARETKRLSKDIDSLIHIDSILLDIKKDAQLTIAYNARYYAFIPRDTDTIRVECKSVDEHKGKVMIRTINGEKPANISTRLTIYNNSDIKEQLSTRPKHTIMPSGSLSLGEGGRRGLYHGDLDSFGKPHGYGRLSSRDGSYYEGEWEHGKRHGFGMSLLAGKRMRIGEWKDDKYLGERITYTDERIYGIDISRYQHEKGRKRFKINWSNLAITSLGTKSKKDISGTVNYPISFIYIKSTEGKSVVNRYFFADYRAARQHGYKVGAYHFFSTKTSGASQAMHFLRKSRYLHGDMPPVLDVEPSPSQIRQMGGVNAMFSHIRKWLSMVESAWNVRPVLYISQTFVNKYLPSAPDLMKDYNVWIARYGEYKPDVNLVYWQLCPDGRVRGIQTEVDINVFNGFEPEWKEYIAP